jgi:predicted enzyme related to lactoylglutathione lyase
VNRVRGESIGGEEIDEIMVSADPKAQWGSLVLLKYLGRAPSPSGEVILGFTTDDLPALLERVTKAGGRIHAPAKEMPELRIRVAFATDPEGHLAELVQVLS